MDFISLNQLQVQSSEFIKIYHFFLPNLSFYSFFRESMTKQLLNDYNHYRNHQSITPNLFIFLHSTFLHLTKASELAFISFTQFKFFIYLKNCQISLQSHFQANYNLDSFLEGEKMKIDPLLEKELQERFSKDNRSVLFVTRVKMFVHIEHDEWQENCSGLLVIYQKRYTYGFTIVSTLDLDINFDFELYSNFPSYTKYIGDLKCIVFLAPSQNNILKLMLVLQSKTELQELKKHIDRIYSVGSKNADVDFLNQPDVQEILKKVPVDESLLANNVAFRDGATDLIKKYFAKTSNSNENRVNSGFKSYAVGREEWKISEQEKQYLRSKYEAEILEQLSKLQKQAKISRNVAK